MENAPRLIKATLSKDGFVNASEMAIHIRAFDWFTTPLGSIEEWPASLQTAVTLCLASPSPMALWWGPSFVKLYNDAYIPFLAPGQHLTSLGRPESDYVETWELLSPILERVFHNGESICCEEQRVITQQNHLQPEHYNTCYQPLHDDKGQIAGIFAVVTPTSSYSSPIKTRLSSKRLLPGQTGDGKQTTEDLCLSHQTLKAFLQASPLAIIIIDSGGNILQWSPAAKNLLGWTETEVLGRPLPFLSSNPQDEFRLLQQLPLQGQTITGTELRRRRKDGTPIEIAVWGSPLYKANGQIGAVLLVIADQTERQQAEAGQAFLATANHLLAQSLDYQTT